MEKKMTKKEKFEMLKVLVRDNEMLVEFIDHEIELLDKKKSNGNAKANEKMEKAVEFVYETLVNMDRAVSVSELIAENDIQKEVFEGQVLRLPPTACLYTVQAGDTKAILCGSEEGYRRKNGTDVFYLGMRVRL